MNATELLTITQLAREYGAKKNTVQHWIKRGWLTTKTVPNPTNRHGFHYLSTRQAFEAARVQAEAARHIRTKKEKKVLTS